MWQPRLRQFMERMSGRFTPPAVLLVHGVAGLQPLPIAIGLVGVAVGLGAGILAVFGVRQRILIAARQRTT